MPYRLNMFEQFFMMKLNKGPAPFMDILGGFSFHAISSALKFNLFEILEKKPQTIRELASNITCDERGLGILLQVLESLKYIKRKGHIYKNTRMTKKWMLNTSQGSFNKGFQYYAPTMNELWPYLNESITNGTPHTNFYKWLEKKPETSKAYQHFMMSLAKMTIPELLKKINIPKRPLSLLDIGGGHGMYSISLCQKYTNIEATIFDSAYSKFIAKKNIQEYGMEHRIKFLEGDYNKDSIGSSFDIIFISNVLHEHTSEENIELLKKCTDALSTNGSLVIMDNTHEKKVTNTMDLICRMFSLVFYHFLNGQNYPFDEISHWLDTAGCKKIKKKNMIKSGFSLITGTI